MGFAWKTNEKGQIFLRAAPSRVAGCCSFSAAAHLDYFLRSCWQPDWQLLVWCVNKRRAGRLRRANSSFIKSSKNNKRSSSSGRDERRDSDVFFGGGEITFFSSDLLKGSGHGGLCAADWGITASSLIAQSAKEMWSLLIGWTLPPSVGLQSAREVLQEQPASWRGWRSFHRRLQHSGKMRILKCEILMLLSGEISYFHDVVIFRSPGH